MTIPVTVIIVTKNEERRIGRCLDALKDFAEVIVLDSGSSDGTAQVAAAKGAAVHNFVWNGGYPKKRQWALDNLKPQHDRVFFVDADEIVTPKLAQEIAALNWEKPAYFVKGRYIHAAKLLQFGLQNNKLALFDRRHVAFPVVDDLGLSGIGEIEGHYQPILKNKTDSVDQLKHALIHDAYDENWVRRHENYAAWEAGMNERAAWPGENSNFRNAIKTIFRALPFRPAAAFLHCYVLKLGFLDGVAGFSFARSRGAYYRMILRANKSRARSGGPSMLRPAADK